ncbi:MAG: chromosomal replication initiator protein DnaA [Deltaproteobacteria bacterium]|nr:chromosomal replication initiator protein DnaA [Deltaproteobacteria bacterium]
MNQIWKQAIAQLEQVIESPFFSTWIKSIRPIDLTPDKITLEVPNRFVLEWIQENYFDLLENTLSELLAVPIKIKLKVGVSQDAEGPEPDMEKTRVSEDNSFLRDDANLSSQVNIETEKNNTSNFNLNPKYSFQEFVAGSSNQFAYAAAMAVANNPATTYNPLFIYGGVGLGKTHLISAIGNFVSKNKPHMQVSYYTSEKFMNELINSLRYAKMDDFRKKFRSVDVLLIDDVQFIAGKERTQEEFFHTFNALYESQKQIVVTSDKFPKDIPGLEERLRSRFEWGLIADIQAPDVETKQAILNLKAEQIGIKLPEDVAFFIANSITSNVRELEGLLNRIGAYAKLTATSVSLSMAKEILKDILVEKNREISVEQIQKVVASHFNIKLTELKSSKRLKALVIPRQIAMYLARQMTSCSYPEIGEKFGGKDHSTIIHAIKKIEKALEDDFRLRSTLENIKKSMTL